MQTRSRFLSVLLSAIAFLAATSAQADAPTIAFASSDPVTPATTTIGLTFGAGLPGTNTLYIAYGRSDAGADIDAWDHCEKVAVLEPETMSFTAAVPEGWGTSVPAFRFFLVDGVPLPYDYAIEYLEATGTQSIDTGIHPSDRTLSRLKFMYPNWGGNWFYGNYVGNDGDDYRFFRAGSDSYFDMTSGRINGILFSDPNGVYEIELGNFYVKDIPTDTVLLSGSARTFSERDYTLQVFCKSEYGRVYSLQIFDGETPVRDFVPCMKDGAACLYDNVSETFFTNASGDDPFVAGPQVGPTGTSDFIVAASTASVGNEGILFSLADAVVTGTVATLTYDLLWTGASDACDIDLAIGSSPDALGAPVRVAANVAGNTVGKAEISDIPAPGQVYYKLIARNAAGQSMETPVYAAMSASSPIYEAVFVPDRNWTGLNGTQTDLSVNLPGGSWIVGSGLDYIRDVSRLPVFDAADGRVTFGDRLTALALPMASTGDYVKPRTITVTAQVLTTQNSSGIGFFSTEPFPTGNYVLPGQEDVEEPETEFRSWNPVSCLSGLVFNCGDNTLQVFYGGSGRGSKVPVIPTSDTYQEFGFTVDTATGDLLYVFMNGEQIDGLSATGVFTDAATAYAGVTSMDYSRTFLHAFSVTSGRDAPRAPIISLVKSLDVGLVGSTLTLAATARDPITDGPAAITVSDAGGLTGYTVVDGVFSCAPAAAGTYTVVFSATANGETTEKSATLRVYPQPAPAPSCGPIYLAQPEPAPSQIFFGGSLWTNVEGRTSYGLAVNRPQGVWISSTGYDWSMPRIYQNATEYDFGNELSSVQLTLASANDYVKPAKLRVEATFRFTGNASVGFWSAIPEHPDSVHNPNRHFSGLLFRSHEKTVQACLEGSAVGAQFPIEFLNADNVYTVSFNVDTQKGKMTDVVWAGFPVVGFEPEGFTDAATSYAGVAVQGNTGNANSRLQLLRFVVSEILPEATVIFVL